MEDVIFWLIAGLAAVLVGMGKGGVPVVAMLSVPLMSLYISPVMAAGLLLPIYIVSDVFGLYAYRHAFDRRVLAIMLPATTLGVGLGWATAHLVPEALVTGIVGAIGAAFALNLLLRRRAAATPRPARVAPGLFWGALTCFTSFVSHAGAPPYQVYTLPLRMSKTVFAGTATIANLEKGLEQVRQAQFKTMHRGGGGFVSLASAGAPVGRLPIRESLPNDRAGRRGRGLSVAGEDLLARLHHRARRDSDQGQNARLRRRRRGNASRIPRRCASAARPGACGG